MPGPDYDTWKLRAPEDELPEEVCPECGFTTCQCFAIERDEESRREAGEYVTSDLK